MRDHSGTAEPAKNSREVQSGLPHHEKDKKLTVIQGLLSKRSTISSESDGKGPADILNLDVSFPNMHSAVTNIQLAYDYLGFKTAIRSSSE